LSGLAPANNGMWQRRMAHAHGALLIPQQAKELRQLKK
jgi:hypothetical protein